MNIELSTKNKTYSDFFILQTQLDSDILSIYDGTSDQAPLIEKLSGNLESFSIIMSTGSSLFIRFQSDTGTEFEGFLIAINYGNT